MVEMAFFKCEKCRSLEGGIYGKGPFKSFHSPQARTCIHQWQKINLGEFRTLATNWMGCDWTQEGQWWNRETTNSIPNQASEAIGASAPQPQR